MKSQSSGLLARSNINWLVQSDMKGRRLKFWKKKKRECSNPDVKTEVLINCAAVTGFKKKWDCTIFDTA